MTRNKKKIAVVLSAAPEREYAFAQIFFKGIRPYLWLIFLIAAAYGQTLWFGYINYDDISLVKQNYGSLGEWTSISRVFKEDVFRSQDGLMFYRPILSLSLMTDAAVSGGRAWGYHLSNILSHLLVCWLVFRLLQVLKYGRGSSFMGSALLAVYPTLVPAVAWIPGRNDVLLAIFVLASFLTFIKYLSKPSWQYYCSSIIFLILALFAKETAVLYPTAALFYFITVYENPGKRKTAISIMVAGWAIALILWYFARLNSGVGAGGWPDSYYRPGEIGKILIGSWSRSLMPFRLSFITDIKDTSITSGLVGLLIGAGLFVFNGFKDRKLAGFGFLWFIMFTLFSIPVRSDINGYLDHRLYLPFFGIVLLFLQVKWQNLKIFNRWSTISAATLIAILWSVTLAYGRMFKSDLDCWTVAVRLSPHSAQAHNTLGVAYSKRGNNPEAAASYKQALINSPNLLISQFNLGTLYYRMGRLDEARRLLTRVVEIRPDYPEANYNLGKVYERQGNTGKARLYYQKQIDSDPRHYGALVSMGALYHQQNNLTAAYDWYQRALRINENDPEVYINMAVLFQQQGLEEMAEAHYKKALEIDPERIELQNNLFLLYQKQGRKAEAQVHWQKMESLKGRSLKH